MNKDFKPRNRKGQVFPRKRFDRRVEILKKKNKFRSVHNRITVLRLMDGLLKTIRILYRLDSECIACQVTRHFTVHNV